MTKHKQTIEDVLEAALKLKRAGIAIPAILDRFPNHRKELGELLTATEQLKELRESLTVPPPDALHQIIHECTLQKISQPKNIFGFPALIRAFHKKPTVFFVPATAFLILFATALVTTNLTRKPNESGMADTKQAILERSALAPEPAFAADLAAIEKETAEIPFGEPFDTFFEEEARMETFEAELASFK